MGKNKIRRTTTSNNAGNKNSKGKGNKYNKDEERVRQATNGVTGFTFQSGGEKTAPPGFPLQSGIEIERKTAKRRRTKRLRREVKHGNGLNKRQPAALTNASKQQNGRTQQTGTIIANNNIRDIKHPKPIWTT